MCAGKIQPIETAYKGYRFRSRLEARWAVVFDAMNLDWDYEVEGFEMENSIYYLPDFIIYNISDSLHTSGKDIYIEVKGRPDTDDLEKMNAFSRHRPLYAVGKVPGDGINHDMAFRSMYSSSKESWHPFSSYYLSNLSECKNGIDAVIDKLIPEPLYPGINTDGMFCLFDEETITTEANVPCMRAAYHAGLCARFEHREDPTDTKAFHAAQHFGAYRGDEVGTLERKAKATEDIKQIFHDFVRGLS